MAYMASNFEHQEVVIMFILEKLYQDGLTAELLEDAMRDIRVQNQALESKRDELKAKLEQ